ncbi:MAG: 30S ribosomal protein S20 [Thermodesulfobacteriota bacterium]
MANHASELKRAKQNEKRNLRNKARKTEVKTMTKKLDTLVAEGKPEDAKKALLAAQKLIDQTAAKGVIRKKTASRKISRLTRRVNKAAK